MGRLGFGLLVMPSSPRGEHFEERVRESIEQAVAAEAAGFDLCMVPEHHQDMGFIPQPLLVAAAIASRTSTIRIGTNIALIGVKHPMQVVEEFYSLDVISGGRVVAGVGLGYQEQDFAMFGRSVRDRAALFEDALEVLNLAGTQEVISFDGRHSSLVDVRVVPRPIQPGGPRIWIGTMTRAGVRRAARLADGLIFGGWDNVEGLRELLDEYVALASQHGRLRSVSLNRWAAIGDTREQARAILEPHAMKAARYYFRHASEMSDSLPSSVRPIWEKADSPGDLAFEDYEQFYVYGTADDCIERLEYLQKSLDLDNIVLQIRSAGGPSHEVVLDQIHRFGEEVIPHFQKENTQ